MEADIVRDMLVGVNVTLHEPVRFNPKYPRFKAYRGIETRPARGISAPTPIAEPVHAR